MHGRRISGLVLLVFGLSGAALGAERATLADAAEHRDAARVRALLRTGVDVNAAQIDGTTALHWAVRSDDVDLVDEQGRASERAGVDAERGAVVQRVGELAQGARLACDAQKYSFTCAMVWYSNASVLGSLPKIDSRCVTSLIARIESIPYCSSGASGRSLAAGILSTCENCRVM